MPITETSNIGVVRIREEARLRYNPLRNLTPEKLVRVMDDFECGYLSEAARIYDAIRRRDDTILSCVQKRKRATARLEWSIVKIGDDENASKEQAEFLEDFYNNILVTSASDGNKRGGMAALIENILCALENKYSVSEIIWNPSEAPNLRAEVRYVPLWFFENRDAVLKFKKSSFDTDGVSLEENGWLIGVSDCALMEATAACYLIKRFALGDWAAVSGRYGSPVPVYNSNAKRDTKEWTEACETIANLLNGYGIVLSPGEVFKFENPTGSVMPFEPLYDRMDRAIAIIWRGSDLATLSADKTGASLQGDETEILEDADCSIVEETIAHYLTKPALEWRFGKITPAAELQLVRKNRTNKIKQIQVYKGAAELGCPVALRDVYETLELRQPEDGEEVVSIHKPKQESVSPLSNAEDVPNADVSEIAKARQLDAADFVKEIERIEKITDTKEWIDAIEALQENLLKYFNGGENEAATLTKILTESVTK